MGEPVTALISFANLGDDTLNITSVWGSLHSVYDFSYVIQNVSFVLSQFLSNNLCYSSTLIAALVL